MSTSDEHAIADQDQAEGSIHRERLLETITSIGKVITVSANLQAVMDAVAEECARLTRADGATIFMVENNRLSAKAAVGILGFAMLEVPIGNNSLPGNAVRFQRAIRSDDTDTDDRTLRRVSSRTGTRSSVSAPFTFDGQQEVAGVLHVASVSPNAFTREDAEIIQIFANVVGAAIQNARQFDRALRESREDALTALLNRRAFDEHAAMLKKEQVNHQQPYSLILFDVNNLKLINDKYGHTSGDRALRLVAAATCQQVRKSDIVYRLGGDEFAVLLPQTTLNVAKVAAERIEWGIGKRKINEFPLSVATGVCQAFMDETTQMLLSRTDELLYKAKRAQHMRERLRGDQHDRVDDHPWR